MIRFMKFWNWEKENLPSITHSIRTAVAATVSVIIARLVHTPEVYWAAIATLVVMQSTRGATLTLSMERIIATAVGASVGAREANFFGANLVAFALAIFLVGLLSIAFRLEKTAYRYASITLTIIVLIPRSAAPWMIALTGSSKSQSASSLLLQWWRCGQNNDDLQSVAPPNSASFAITSALAKEINFR
jgi:uncharacterized membrane protein YccC